MADSPVQVPPITETQLYEMLRDPEIPDEKIAPYLTENLHASTPYAPIIQPNPATVEPSLEQGAVLLSNANALARWRRNQRYKTRIKTWDGPRLVSEGDSWFQYPILLKDVIDQLEPNYAIRSLGAAGDLVSDMVTQNELIATVMAEKPDGVLLSGGGNDLLGEGRLVRALKHFDPALDVPDYVTQDFEETLKATIQHYRALMFRLVRNFPGMPVFCHSYDHAIPDKGRWLGKPMEKLEIRDPALQRKIVAHLVDRFHSAMVDLVAEPTLNGSVHLVDCRDLVNGDWFDELHPRNVGFARVGQLFDEALSQNLAAGSAMAATPSITPPFGANEAADEVVMLASALSDDALIAEIGRRSLLLSAEPELNVGGSEAAISMAASGGEESFKTLGQRILRRLSRELHGLICGENPDDEEERKKFLDALGLGGPALAGALVQLLVGAFALAPAVATVLAAFLIRRVLRPTLEETCAVWARALS